MCQILCKKKVAVELKLLYNTEYQSHHKFNMVQIEDQMLKAQKESLKITNQLKQSLKT